MKGDEIPEWFAFPPVVGILKQYYGPKDGVVQSENAVPQF